MEAENEQACTGSHQPTANEAVAHLCGIEETSAASTNEGEGLLTKGRPGTPYD